MREPESLLRQEPDESPPTEIVLAAVRVFRYRLLAVIALGLALAVVGSAVVERLNANDRLLVEIANARYEGGTLQARGLGEARRENAISVTAREIVTGPLDGDGGPIYVHLIGRDDRGRGGVLDVEDTRISGSPAPTTGIEGSASVHAGVDRFDLWFSVERSRTGPLTFEAVVTSFGAGDATELARIPFDLTISEGI